MMIQKTLSVEIRGLGDPFLEALLVVAVRKTMHEGDMPSDEIFGLLLSALRLANERSADREPTVRLMRNVFQALLAAGWDPAASNDISPLRKDDSGGGSR